MSSLDKQHVMHVFIDKVSYLSEEDFFLHITNSILRNELLRNDHLKDCRLIRSLTPSLPKTNFPVLPSLYHKMCYLSGEDTLIFSRYKRKPEGTNKRFV